MERIETQGAEDNAGAMDIAALAEAIKQRDAEARMAHKAERSAVPELQQRLEGLQQRFAMWCANELEVEVRRADMLLTPARYRMQQTMAPLPGCRYLDDSPARIIAHTEIALWRDNDRHVLRVALHGDGVVRTGNDRAIDHGTELFSIASAEAVARCLIFEYFNI